MIRPLPFLAATIAGLAAAQWWRYRSVMPAIDARTAERLGARPEAR